MSWHRESRSVEEQARRVLWAFPGWVRADRGEEALSLVLDQVSPAATRLPLRSRLDLLRAGLHARRRATPPWPVWFEVMAADSRNQHGRIPDAWRPWLVDWIGRPTWRRRFLACWAVVATAAFGVFGPWRSDGSQATSVVATVVNLALWVGMVTWFQAERAPRWRWSVAVSNGLEPLTLAPFDDDLTQIASTRPRMANRPAVLVAAIGTGAGALLAAAGTAVSVLAWPVGRATSGVTLDSLLYATIVLVVVTAALRSALRQVADAPAAGVGFPDPSTYVDHPRRRAGLSRVPRLLLAAFVAVSVMWMVVTAGASGVLLCLALTAGAVVELVAIRRRERQIGRALGAWEVWPVLGPAPFLLLREDIAKEARRAYWAAPPATRRGPGTPSAI